MHETIKDGLKELYGLSTATKITNTHTGEPIDFLELQEMYQNHIVSIIESMGMDDIFED